MLPAGRLIALFSMLTTPALAAPVATPEYFPLPADAFWEYREGSFLLEIRVAGRFSFDGEMTTRVDAPEPGGTVFEYFTADSRGILLHGGRVPDPDVGTVTIDFDPPLVLVPEIVDLGDFGSSTGGIVASAPGFLDIFGSYSNSWEILDEGRIETPAGVFCEAITIRGTLTSSIAGTTVIDDTDVTLARGVGPVHEIGTIDGEAFEQTLSDTSLPLPPRDFDCDEVEDFLDNCPAWENFDQLDSGGINGVGDACECGDVSDDGDVGIVDVVYLARDVAGLEAPSLPAPLKCHVAPGGDCNEAQLIALREDLAGVAAREPLCEPATGQVPFTTRFSFDQDANSWTTAGGSVQNDDVDFVEGTGSLIHAKSIGLSGGIWRADLGGVDWQDRVVRIDVKLSNVGLVSPGGGIRLLLSHTPGPWVPADWAAWVASPAGLVSGEWATLEFDLSQAADLVFGSGADLSQLRFLGLQTIDAGSGAIEIHWDHLRTIP
jgi:hypothetical protein